MSQLFEQLPAIEQYRDWKSWAQALSRQLVSANSPVVGEIDPALVNGPIAEVTALVGVAQATADTAQETGTAAQQTAAEAQSEAGTKEPAIAVGTATDYWRGDKTWQVLDKNAVGLGLADNTPDALKPLSADMVAALAAKLDDTQADAFGLLMLATATASAARGLLRNYARAYVSATLAGVDYTAGVSIPFDAEETDTGGWHDNVTNNHRMTVPAGVSCIELGGVVCFANVTAALQITIQVFKNGSAAYHGAVRSRTTAQATAPIIPFASGPIDVVAGDYFEVRVSLPTDTSIDIVGGTGQTSFWIKAAV